MRRRRDAYIAEFRAVRPSVLIRDRYCCVKCGDRLNLEVHHVYGYEDSKPEHLQTLRYWCHLIAPMGEEYWEWKQVGLSGMDHAFNWLIEQGWAASFWVWRCLESYTECIAYDKFMRRFTFRRTRKSDRISS